MTSCMIDIRVNSPTKEYSQGDVISGTVVVKSSTAIQHSGLLLSLDGNVTINASNRAGVFEVFYNNAKLTPLISSNIELAKPGKLPAGLTELPFELSLRPKSTVKHLFETYHGVFINVQYFIKVDMKRTLLSKDLSKQLEIIMTTKSENELMGKAVPSPLDFSMASDAISNLKEKSNVPTFRITGYINSTCCCINKALDGHLILNECNQPVKSIELQLMRVETCDNTDGFSKDITEIQNIQIGEGDVLRGIQIPIYMIFPRLFTCPTLITPNFKIEFEVNVVVIFDDDTLIKRNIPLKLTRF